MNIFFLTYFGVFQSLLINKKYQLQNQDVKDCGLIRGILSFFSNSLNWNQLLGDRKYVEYSCNKLSKENSKNPINNKSWEKNLYNFEIKEMLSYVNKIRAEVGVAPLEFHRSLMNAALSHSVDQSNPQIKGHIGSDGSDVGKRLLRQNFKWRFVAENIAFNQGSVSDVMIRWIESPGHYNNIVSSEARYFGAAVVKSHWTQVFAS